MSGSTIRLGIVTTLRVASPSVTEWAMVKQVMIIAACRKPGTTISKANRNRR